MKKILISCLILTVIGFAGMTFAKSSNKSKSSKGTSKQNHDTSGKQNQDSSGKQTKDPSSDKQSQHRKNQKTHRCKLPDGKVDTSMSQQDCLKANGKWVKN